ncbi:MAG: hypothetical protein ACK5Z2_20075 [Bacteroidota bacterium]
MLNYRLFFWPVLLLLLIRSGVTLWQYNFSITDNDQSLYWLAANDLAHGESIPAFVYGQDYNYFIEPWLAALPVFFGVTPEYALPVVTLFMSLLPFLSFAFDARRRKLNGGALLWLLVPLLLPSGWFVITAMPRGFVNGLFLFAAWPFIQRIRRDGLRWLFSGVLFAVAAAVNPNTIPLIVCCGAVELTQHFRRPAFYLLHLAGAAPFFAAHYFITQHAQQQPGGLLHPKWGLEWTFDYFAEGISHISQWLRWIVPGNAGLWLLLPLIFLLGWLLIYQRRRSLIFALTALLLVLVFSLGINKLHDGREHLHYPFSRMWLALPIAAAFLAERIRINRLIALPLFLTTAVLSVFSFGLPDASQQSAELPLRIMSVDSLRKQVAELTAIIEAEKPAAVIGLGYPAWVGDQQLIFHYAETHMIAPPLFVIPDYERRRERTLLPLRGRILLLGGDETQWKEFGEIEKVVNVCGTSSAWVVRR